jgi:Putative DNA-binding domain
MTLANRDLQSLVEGDLQQLIELGVTEGISIEYKLQNYGNKDADIKEFLKDVSSFSNTAGGHLIIGMAETNSVPTDCEGVASNNLEIEKSRYENYCRDCIEPRIVGLRIHSIGLASGNAVIVIKIPRSLNPPHRVVYKNSNRFYARNSTGAYELSVEELRAAFGSSQSVQERIRAFRREQVNKLIGGDTPVDLAEDAGTLILHLLPYSSFSLQSEIDLKTAESLTHNLRPMGSTSGYAPRINIDGFINIRGGTNCYGYTQLFRNGCIEAVKVRILFDRNGTIILGSVDFESTLVEAVPKYLSALKILGIDCPIVVAATILGVKGAVFGIGGSENAFDPPDPIRRDNIFLPEIVIEEYSTEDNYVKKLKTLIDVLWNAAGRIESKNFDAQGAWKNPGYR